MRLNHLEQMCWAFNGSNPAIGVLIGETFTKDMEQGFELEPIDDNGKAIALIESKGFDAAKRASIGDYFWHPKCVMCERCRRHRPECYYDKRLGLTTLLCDRCSCVLNNKG